jgi:Ca2+-binding RTX toxin-like protein
VTTIENAIGGSARDLLWGNEVANVLNGMGGDDVIRGFGGNDTLYGGAGKDVFVLDNDGSRDRIADFVSGKDKIDLTNVAGATSKYVSFDATHHLLQIDTNHDGVYDMFADVFGSNVAKGDILFHA